MKSFSERVLDIVKKIPRGKITAYEEIARALGYSKGKLPLASCAVGRALAKNPEPPRIPCHRVVRNNGSLGGYVFGIEEKKLLLDREGISIKNNRVASEDLRTKSFKPKFGLIKS